jgi:hypothetical protein
LLRITGSLSPRYPGTDQELPEGKKRDCAVKESPNRKTGVFVSYQLITIRVGCLATVNPIPIVSLISVGVSRHSRHDRYPHHAPSTVKDSATRRSASKVEIKLHDSSQSVGHIVVGPTSKTAAAIGDGIPSNAGE